MADGNNGPTPSELGIPSKDLGIKTDQNEAQVSPLLDNQPKRAEILEQQSSLATRINTGVQVNKENKTAVLIEEEIRKGNGKIPYSTFMGLRNPPLGCLNVLRCKPISTPRVLCPR